MGEYTSVCVRADDVILNRPGQNTKVLTTCSYDTVDREIFAHKNFRLLNVRVVLCTYCSERELTKHCHR